MGYIGKRLVCGVAGLALGGVLSTGTAALAEEIVGKPRVVDADTLDFSGRLVRLYGIDALEIDQDCGAEGRYWACGKEARWAALDRLSPHWLTCVVTGSTNDGMTMAVCYLAGVGQYDVNAWLVEQGWALADRDATDAYVAAEDAARRAGRGLWRGTFVPPWDWRAGRRLP
jgi:endonuclease YncB( thermonuclease family)